MEAGTGNPPPGAMPPGVPPPPQPRGRSPWGVVAIVAGACAVVGLVGVVILAAILLPVFAQARERARTASCRSNLVQLGTAMQMYTQDWDELLPPAEGWSDVVQPYVRNTGVLQCPSDDQFAHGYAYNSVLSGVNVGRIDSPAEAPMLFESTASDQEQANPLASFTPRHRRAGERQGHIVWVDGHVTLESAPPAPNAGGIPGTLD